VRARQHANFAGDLPNLVKCPGIRSPLAFEYVFAEVAFPQSLEGARKTIGQKLDAERAAELGLVTFALDDIDWEDEIRVLLEERASFSPDGLTGLEANLRFGGPETMETKIFARLTAWQNWIFQRPNAVGEEGALRRYGTGQKAVFDTKRV